MVDQSGGEPERGGAVNAMTTTTAKELRSSSEKRVPQPLGITRKLPWHRRGPEEVGGALAPEQFTGVEEEVRRRWPEQDEHHRVVKIASS